ncbi:MAG: patatin-like phospholipase family protein [Candidatus Binatia bacterium]
MQFDMVFEGGGAKGMVFVGAMKALEAGNHTSGRVVGTSAGAITATLLAVGYNAADMEKALGEKDDEGNPVFASFMDPPAAEDFTPVDVDDSVTMKLFKTINLPLIPEWAEERADKAIIARLMGLKAYAVLFSFIERGGLYVGNAFLDWLRKKLKEKGASYADMTLAQLYGKTGRDLSLVATDTAGHNMLVLNHRTAPNCPVAWAVRMSMSIPFAWHEVRWQAAWDPYRRYSEDGTRVQKEMKLAGHTIVDGGVLSNFPIDMLTSDEPSVRAVMGDTIPKREAVLGLLIDEMLEVENAPPPPDDDENDEEGVAGNIKKLRTVKRVSRLLNTMMKAHDKRLIGANKDLICHLPAETYGTMEFDMTDERKAALVAAGEKAMNAHLAGRLGLQERTSWS